MAAPRVRRGWVEAGFVGGSCSHCLGHFVVDFEDDELGAVFAVLFLILSLHYCDSFHDVGHGEARNGREPREARDSGTLVLTVHNLILQLFIHSRHGITDVFERPWGGRALNIPAHPLFSANHLGSSRVASISFPRSLARHWFSDKWLAKDSASRQRSGGHSGYPPNLSRHFFKR